jgi:CheY-like chemotaxis protein/anti-sigma regulatory factor (Ser/Thr protein kinase)
MLLDTARGRIVGTAEPVDLADLVGEIVEVLEPKAAQRVVRLERALPDELWVQGNRAQLFTAIWNLVQNAIEATPESGAVRIRAAAERDTVRLVIEDDGSGVPEAQRARIFDPYFTTKESGTGLGLALVRRAIDALEGTVALEDAPSGGARFVVVLPAASARRARSRIEPRRASGVLERGDPRGKRILVVDDDPPMRDLLATALGLAGATVVTAENAAEAMNVEGPFDLALIDLGLGDLRGDRLLAELRRRGTVTRAALVSGASIPPGGSIPGSTPDAWLRKPFEIDDLLTAVRHLIGDTATDDAASQ